MTSFNIEDAIQLRNHLERCRETYRYEWESVRQRWQDLKYGWNDNCFWSFEADFQQVIQAHDHILGDIERQLQSLDRSIPIASSLNEKLNNCNDLSNKNLRFQQQIIQKTSPAETKSNLSGESSESDSDIKSWENAWSDLIQSANSLARKTGALAMMSISIVAGISRSQPFIQANKLGTNLLKSGINFVVNDFQKVVDLNNETLGSDISNLPDESVFKVIAKLSEDAEKRHFSTEDIADLIGQYTDWTVKTC